jgi:HlyD family secretion protein
MQHKRPPILVIVILLLTLAIAGWFVIQNLNHSQNGVLKASGTIEAVNVKVASELAGKVAEVMVDEGDVVKAGEVLFRLDGDMLQAQQEVAASGLDAANASIQTAQTALASAEAQYDLTLASARAQDRQLRLQDWFPAETNPFDQPAWYFSRDEQLPAAQADVEAAQAALDQAKSNLTEVEGEAEKADFLQAESALAQARLAYLSAKDVYDLAQRSDNISPGEVSLPSDLNLPPYVPAYRVKIAIAKTLPLNDNDKLIDSAKDSYDAAQDDLDRAQQRYDNLLTTQAADDVLTARAEVAVAQERYDTAQDRLLSLQYGSQSLQVAAAQKAVEQARAGGEQAQKAVEQAQAQLNLIDTQIEKLSVSSPVAAVVLTRNIQPGEIAQPGSTSLVLAQLKDLTITVYVPEDRYGEIRLGQQATVSVDSFPGESFNATVSYISDQAEFTPRNVQTVEGRSSTVYAIKLRLDDPQGKLKPGMPADVVFIK